MMNDFILKECMTNHNQIINNEFTVFYHYRQSYLQTPKNVLLILYINVACLSVCLYTINVRTAEPIGPKFFVGHHVTTGKVYE